MDVVADLSADPQATEPVEVGERALHDPAFGADCVGFKRDIGGFRHHAVIEERVKVGEKWFWRNSCGP
ncbi:hypothetical protein ACFXDP_00130 [Streptomyces sp. NPDC059374]|uniref:hypothetical protein n=1 Tax=Streptomyces sp. NPDC059374 TaxID=3346814 RepID=UPI0036B93D79